MLQASDLLDTRVVKLSEKVRRHRARLKLLLRDGRFSSQQRYGIPAFISIALDAAAFGAKCSTIVGHYTPTLVLILCRSTTSRALADAPQHFLPAGEDTRADTLDLREMPEYTDQSRSTTRIQPVTTSATSTPRPRQAKGEQDLSCCRYRRRRRRSLSATR